MKTQFLHTLFNIYSLIALLYCPPTIIFMQHHLVSGDLLLHYGKDLFIILLFEIDSWV